LLVILGLVLGLMSKPMLVTLPFVLLLLDWWPLGRLSLCGPRPFRSAGRLIVEKVPLLIVAAIFAVVASVAQKRLGALASVAQLPLSARLAQVPISYLVYLRRAVLPYDLAPFYPRSGDTVLWWHGALALLVLASVTALLIRQASRFPYLAMGWLWFLGTLVPVIGLVQIGRHVQADRYAYIPMVGFLIAVSWSAFALAQHSGQLRLAVWLGGLTIACLTATTWLQVGHWRNSVLLWEHALRVTAPSAVAHNNLGVALLSESDLVPARRHFEEALRLDPDHVPAYLSLGLLFQKQRNPDAAIRSYRQALRRNPESITGHVSLGAVWQMKGEYAEASQQFQEALRLDSGNVSAHNNLGVALLNLGQFPQAIHHLQEALRLGPSQVGTWANLGLAFEYEQKWDDAARCFRQAIALQPLAAGHHRELAYSLYERGRMEDARAEYAEALRLDPAWPTALARTAWSLATNPDAKRRNGRRALRLARQLEQATGGSATALDNLAAAQAENGDFAEAAATARRALAAAGRHTGLAAQIEARLQLYRTKRPYRETGP
jgi:tetratricopeptide (TPR) repeat protein